jgi:hypothetical protein
MMTSIVEEYGLTAAQDLRGRTERSPRPLRWITGRTPLVQTRLGRQL